MKQMRVKWLLALVIAALMISGAALTEEDPEAAVMALPAEDAVPVADEPVTGVFDAAGSVEAVDAAVMEADFVDLGEEDASGMSIGDADAPVGLQLFDAQPSEGGMTLTAQDFEDPVLWEYLIANYDNHVADGVLDQTEIDGVTEILVAGDSEADGMTGKGRITSLKGIGYFPNLQYLDCGNNPLTTLDVSKNTRLGRLYCYNCRLTELDVSHCPELWRLDCINNAITTLDISNCPSLVSIVDDAHLHNGTFVHYYSYVDVSDTVSFYDTDNRELVYDERVTLTAGSETIAGFAVPIDEAHFPDPALREMIRSRLDWKRDGLLSKREIEAATGITLVQLDENGRVLYDSMGNPIAGLGISSLKGLEYLTSMDSLYCPRNPIPTLSVQEYGFLKRLKFLTCQECGITAMDLSGCTNLTFVRCDGNQLTTLNLGGCSSLSTINCLNNPLTALDISDCPTLLENLKGCHIVTIGTLKQYVKAGANPYLVCDEGLSVTGIPDGTLVPAPTSAAETIKSSRVNMKVTVSAAPGSTRTITVNDGTAKGFKSSNRKVATVDGNGKVTFKKAGKTKITFKVGKKKRSITLVVKDPTVPGSVTISASGPLTGKKGTTVTLTAVLPEGTRSAIIWKSSNKKVATVSKTGLVTFKKPGKATITATCARGKKKRSVKVRVN